MPDAAPAPTSPLLLAQLQRRLRLELRRFRKITGLTAVASVATLMPASGAAPLPTPPVHPQCARKVRRLRSTPCGDQWLAHLRRARRSRRAHLHACPIGLRCTCVPVYHGPCLLGVVKLVAAPTTTDEAFASAMGVLEMSVSETCLNTTVLALTEQLQALRRHSTTLERTKAGGFRPGPQTDQVAAPSQTNGARDLNTSLVNQTIAYLQSHFLRSTLSLAEVAASLDCNPRYLTTRFTEVVGERMRVYLHALRIAHACRLLIDSDLRVKEVAHASGFSSTSRFTATFRRHVGVSASAYRRIFSRTT